MRLPPLPIDLPRVGSAIPAGRGLGPCPLCGREMIAGPSVEAHHPVPKSRGGRVTVDLHRVCHRRIHAEFTEKELAERWHDMAALRAHPPLADFIRWIARKPPEFTALTFKRKR